MNDDLVKTALDSISIAVTDIRRAILGEGDKDALSYRLLQTVTGEVPMPWSHERKERSPGVAALGLAAYALNPEDGSFNVSMPTPEQNTRARELLNAAGYFPGFQRPDGKFVPAPVFAFPTLNGLKGFTPSSEMFDKIRRHCIDYNIGVINPYVFAREFVFYGLDPFKFYPGVPSTWAESAINRALNDHYA